MAIQDARGWWRGNSYRVARLNAIVHKLFNLLNSLTANHFHGMIVSASEKDVTLTSWTVRLSDVETDVLYSCKVGYQAYMPNNKIKYQYKKES